jgi:hypothetical protein
MDCDNEAPSHCRARACGLVSDAASTKHLNAALQTPDHLRLRLRRFVYKTEEQCEEARSEFLNDPV